MNLPTNNEEEELLLQMREEMICKVQATVAEEEQKLVEEKRMEMEERLKKEIEEKEKILLEEMRDEIVKNVQKTIDEEMAEFMEKEKKIMLEEIETEVAEMKASIMRSEEGGDMVGEENGEEFRRKFIEKSEESKKILEKQLQEERLKLKEESENRIQSQKIELERNMDRRLVEFKENLMREKAEILAEEVKKMEKSVRESVSEAEPLVLESMKKEGLSRVGDLIKIIEKKMLEDEQKKMEELLRQSVERRKVELMAKLQKEVDVEILEQTQCILKAKREEMVARVEEALRIEKKKMGRTVMLEEEEEEEEECILKKKGLQIGENLQKMQPSDADQRRVCSLYESEPHSFSVAENRSLFQQMVRQELCRLIRPDLVETYSDEMVRCTNVECRKALMDTDLHNMREAEIPRLHHQGRHILQQQQQQHGKALQAATRVRPSRGASEASAEAHSVGRSNRSDQYLKQRRAGGEMASLNVHGYGCNMRTEQQTLKLPKARRINDIDENSFERARMNSKHSNIEPTLSREWQYQYKWNPTKSNQQHMCCQDGMKQIGGNCVDAHCLNIFYSIPQPYKNILMIFFFIIVGCIIRYI